MILETRDALQGTKSHNFACAHVTFPEIFPSASDRASQTRDARFWWRMTEWPPGHHEQASADLSSLTSLLSYTVFGKEREAKRSINRRGEDYSAIITGGLREIL
jgi:hypothetical protein